MRRRPMAQQRSEDRVPLQAPRDRDGYKASTADERAIPGTRIRGAGKQVVIGDPDDLGVTETLVAR